MSDSLGDLLVRLDADSAEFRAGVEKANESLESLEKKVGEAKETLEHLWELKAAETAKEILEGVWEHLENIAKAEAEVARGAANLDVSVGFLSELRFASEEAGVGANQLEKALFNLEKAAGGLSEGWKKHGLEIRNANGELKTGEELFKDATEYVAHLGSQQERAAAQADLFGKGSRTLGIVIRELGEEGFDALRAKMERLGGGIDETSAKLGLEFVKTLGEVETASKNLTRVLVDELEPGATKSLSGIANILGGVTNALKNFNSNTQQTKIGWTDIIASMSPGGVAFEATRIAINAFSTETTAAAKAEETLEDKLKRTDAELAEHEKALDKAVRAAHKIATEALAGVKAEYDWRKKQAAEELKQFEERLRLNDAYANAQRTLYERELSGQTKVLAIQEQLAKYAKIRSDEARTEAEHQRESREAIENTRAEKQFETVHKHIELARRESEHLERQWASTLVGAARTFVSELRRGAEALDILRDLALQLLENLIAAAAEMALFQAIKMSGLLAPGGVLSVFLGLTPMVGAAEGLRIPANAGLPGKDSVPILAQGGETVLTAAETKTWDRMNALFGSSEAGLRGSSGSGVTVNASLAMQSFHPQNITSSQQWMQRDFVPAFRQMIRTGQLDDDIRRILR